MRKYLLALLATTILICSALSITFICGCGETYTEGLEYELDSRTKTYKVTGIGDAHTQNLIIPAVYNDVPVTEIAQKAFANLDKLESVTIGDGVRTIGYAAFSCCTNLKSVTLPKSVDEIINCAFEGCVNLENITISEENTAYRAIDNNIVRVDSKALAVGGKDCVIPSDGSVTRIGRYAFSKMSNITEIVIPDFIEEIELGAFSGCTGLSTLTVPYVKNCLAYYFGVDNYVANESFVPASLKKVIITGRSSINSNAFAGCTNIETVILNEDIPRIGEYAFAYCRSLVSINVPKNVTIINQYTFSDCKKLTNIVLPNTLKTIRYRAFENCIGFTRIDIPASVNLIESSAFIGCDSVTEIKVANDNSTYYCSNNCIIETASKKLVLGSKNSLIPSDGSVAVIGEYAFYKLKNLKNITLPDSIVEIESYAFGESGLREITIPRNVTAIGLGTFYNCTSLVRIKLEETSQWYVSMWLSFEPHDYISKESLDNEFIAANYFKSTYWRYHWKRR